MPRLNIDCDRRADDADGFVTRCYRATVDELNCISIGRGATLQCRNH